MQKIYQTAIIGGGASGILCAVELLNGGLNSSDLLLLERNDRIGKKLIATGNGQGNLSNAEITEKNYHGNKEFIKSFISTTQKLNIKDYLYNLGIPLTHDEEGRIYPLSKQASAVLDVLRFIFAKYNFEPKTGERVVSVEKTEDIFSITTENGGKYFAKTVVLSTGGKAGKQFGTDGTAYCLAEKFGHLLTELYPSLVQLKTETNCIRGLKGLKERARVFAMDGDKQLFFMEGDILFTEYGVSGNTVFQLSSYLVDAKNPYIRIEFLPQLSLTEVEKILQDRENMLYIEKGDKLCAIVNKKIGQAVIKYSGDTSPKGLSETLKNFNLKVTGNLGFSYAQVTKGGIDTKDVDDLSFESKLCKNLYLTGEILNVDGCCGGYNLTFAFVSGICTAKSILSKLS